jgi:hypothetical protein
MDEQQMQAYFDTLRETMERAIAEAERLSAETQRDIDATAELQALARALMRQYEQAAKKDAELEARAWAAELRNI